MSIKLLNRPSIQRVAEMWKDQYQHDSDWIGKREQTYHDVLSASSLDQVDAIIGNSMWTRNRCCACRELFDVGVEMLEPDYETTPTFCANCIRIASDLIKAEEN